MLCEELLEIFWPPRKAHARIWRGLTDDWYLFLFVFQSSPAEVDSDSDILWCFPSRRRVMVLMTLPFLRARRRVMVVLIR